MDNRVVISCQDCRRPLRIPADRGTLRIRCPHCQAEFVWTPDPPPQPEPEYVKVSDGGWPRWLKAAVAIGVLVGIFALAKYFGGSNGSKGQSLSPGSPIQEIEHRSQQRSGPQWVRISYDDLIDKGIITHSGKTVGGLLDESSSASPSGGILSNLQPYLEPFSFVCNDVVAAANPADTTPYVNVVADYPAGSRQPAWAALFREGHYQLFVGEGKARLFLKGKNPADLFRQRHGVIRHPLREALDAAGADKMTVEVYAFDNNYTSRTISLDLSPYVVEVTAGQLGPRAKELPLAGLAEFLDQGVTLEAAEIDENGYFYLYGTPSARQTVAGCPKSLEDFAVVYRSMFHHGHNAPYISLDRHEDNRYAKVNFGGLLEDTRVGSVVLEADKLFKTMSTGLDPNTRTVIKGKIRNAVPDFVTEDERGLREKETGYIKIRYWFYPDGIRTVTDGHIGAIQQHQFLAAAERTDSTDSKVTLGRAQRETIDHLNRNFDQYAEALPTYRELDTVGRMMAIVNWLQQSSARDRVDLDALLSVELSLFKTPRRTKKLLALTAEAYTSEGAEGSGGARSKVYSFDKVLEGLKPSTDDKVMLEIAGRHFTKIDDPELIPSEDQNARAARAKIERMEARVKSLGARIERERMTLDRSSEYEVNRFNAMVEEFNSLRAVHNDAVNSYNQSVRGMRGAGRRTLVSVGGGINLRPKDFAKPINMPDSPLLQRIRSAREVLRSSPGTVAGMTRSVAKRTGETVAERPPRPWRAAPDRSTGELTKRQWSNGGQGSMSVEANPKSGYTHYRVATQGYFSEMTVKPGRNEVVMASSAYPTEIVATGDFSQGGTIVLRRGKKIGGPAPKRDAN